MQNRTWRLAVPILLLTAPQPGANGQEVFVTIEPHDYTVHQDFTQRELSARRGSRTLAYTQANFGIEFFYQLAPGQDPGHITAVFNAKLKTGHQEIQIPSEYAPDSCEYRVLLNHELQHVARNVEAMVRLKQQIEKEQSAKPSQDFVGKTSDQVVDILQSALDSGIAKSYNRKYTDLRHQLNDPLDSEPSLEEQHRQCHNWLNR